MVEREDLEKLFDAALNDGKAPSRFGTPDEQRRVEPSAFRRPVAGEPNAENPFKLAPVEENQASPFTANVFQAAPSEAEVTPEVVLCEKAVVSLDQTLNAELAEILDAKIAKEKRSKRRSRMTMLAILFLIFGGGTGWVVSNPARYQAFKDVLSEIRSVADIGQMVEKYQKSLDKVAERGNHIDAASAAMGVDVSKVDENDGAIDAEMKKLIGEGGGKTTGERDKLLKEKFKSVQEKGKIGGGN